MQVEPGTLLPRELGNCYTASLWAGLASLVSAVGGRLEGRQVLLFSYGSGIASSCFILEGRRPAVRWRLERLATEVISEMGLL